MLSYGSNVIEKINISNPFFSFFYVYGWTYRVFFFFMNVEKRPSKKFTRFLGF